MFLVHKCKLILCKLIFRIIYLNMNRFDISNWCPCLLFVKNKRIKHSSIFQIRKICVFFSSFQKEIHFFGRYYRNDYAFKHQLIGIGKFRELPRSPIQTYRRLEIWRVLSCSALMCQSHGRLAFLHSMGGD